ncbi:MAG: glycosyltransferase family 39 protein [Ardenticatenaceae bacterium]|nr:glycosyltransferase family 39 protein [Ardenticatenaceae bacterium]
MTQSNSDDSQLLPWLKWGGVALFVGWLFFSLSAYYVVQKPFSADRLAVLLENSTFWLRFSFSAAALGRSLLDIAAALWLAWVALGVGLPLLARFRLEMSHGERFLLALGLGFGVLGLLTLLLGMVGWLATAVFYTLFILLTLLTSRASFQLVRQLRLPKQGRGTAVYLFLALGMMITLALLPPTSFDALLYHLKGPKLFLEAGKIQAYDIFPFYFPSLFEMFYLMAMAIRGDVTAKLLHVVFHFMLVGLIYITARRHLNLKEGWTAVLFFYAMPLVLTLATWAYSDLGLAFYQMAAVYASLHWRQNRQLNWLLLSGALAGLAMGFKYTSFITPLFMAGIVLWDYRREWKTAVRPLAQLTLITTLVGAPMYIRNWILVGNPVYPFLYDWFDGRYWDTYRAISYAEAGTGIGFDPIAILRLPYDVTLGYKDVTQDVQLGPLTLAFLPLLLIYGLRRWRKRTPPAFTILLLFALAQYGFWTMGVISTKGLWQSRMLLSMLVVLVPAIAWVWQDTARWDHPQFSLQRFLKLVLGVVLALNLISQFTNWLSWAPWAYVIGTDSRETTLRRTLGAHYGAMEAINDLPPDAVVAFLYEPRSYYCERDCRPDSKLDELGHWLYLYSDAAGIAASWREQDITHVLLHQVGYNFMVVDGSEEALLVQELQADYLTPVADVAGAFILYEVTFR